MDRGMKRRGWLAAGICAMAGLGGLLAAGPGEEFEGDKVRIGTYDSRAVAIAYGRSALKARVLGELRSKYDGAKQAGDDRTVKELEGEGQAQQIRMHLQAFSTAPVEDCLQAVQDDLPGVARQMRVVVITRAADYHDESVELVDVTDQIAALFKPDAKTLAIIADIRKQPPMAIEAAAKIPANE